MLQAIRSKAGSLIVKILFALLIVSFGVWGIGDIFLQRHAPAPASRNRARVSDRNNFTNILASNQLTEDRYVSMLRRDIARSNLTGAIAGGAVAPTQLIDPLYRTRNEKRVADTVLVASEKMTGIAEPTEAELQDFHAKHEDAFRAPENRGL